MSTKRTVFGLLAVGLLGTALTAGMCTPTPSGKCTGEADCADGERCHPTLKTCVANCVKQTGACDSDPGTTCSTADIGGVDFKNICVCTTSPESCTGTDKCNPIDLVCDAPCTGDGDCSVYEQTRTCRDSGGTNFCLPAEGSCTGNPSACTADQVCDATGACVAKCTVGGANPCVANKYCDDDRWSSSPTWLCVANPTTCDTETNCLTPTDAVPSVCDPDTTNETHNLCVAPDSIATCTAASKFTNEIATGGPVIYDAEFVADADFDADCDTAVAGTSGYTATFFYYDFEDDAYSQTSSSGSYAAFKWARDTTNPASATLPVSIVGDSTTGVIVMVICFTSAPTSVAIQIADSASHVSNVMCAGN